MDLKKVNVEYLLQLNNEEMNMIFRALGVATGVPGAHGIRPEELSKAQELSVKISRLRMKVLKQLYDRAVRANENAEEFSDHNLEPV